MRNNYRLTIAYGHYYCKNYHYCPYKKKIHHASDELLFPSALTAGRKRNYLCEHRISICIPVPI